MYYKNNKKKHIINTQCLTNPNRSALVELLADSFKTDHNMGFDNTLLHYYLTNYSYNKTICPFKLIISSTYYLRE